jgi:purine nucleoside phosphorylase
MTGMPEASLARELELCYATCAVVLNWAAGIGDSDHIDTDTFDQYIKMGMDKVRLLLQHVIPLL